MRGLTVVRVGVTRAVTEVVVTVGVTRVTDVVVTVVLTAVVLTLVVVRPTAVFATLVLAIVPRPAMFPVTVDTAAPRPAMVAVVPTALPATFGLMRAVMFGVRVPTLRLGVRMMLCASAAPDKSSARLAAISVAAAPCLALQRSSLCAFNRASPHIAAADKTHCAGAARLMIFSFCSRAISADASCFDIGLSPNCRRNMPPAVLSMMVAWLASRNAAMSEMRASGANLTKARGSGFARAVSRGAENDAV